jgi:hypothetical protein
MRYYASVCMQVMLAARLLGSAAQKPDAAALLEGYNLCNKEFETIAYDLESESQLARGRLIYTLKHCADHDKVQWIGRRAYYDAQVAPQSVVPERVASTYDGTRLAFLYRDFSPKYPKHPPAGQVCGRAGSLLPKIRQGWGETIEYGGPLVGKVPGSDYHSVYDLLKAASKVTLHDTATKILGYDAYLIEAKTKYGMVRAWISPDAGHNCLKWEIVKAQNQFYRDGAPVEMTSVKWVAAYEAERVERIDERTITTQAKFEIVTSDGVTQHNYGTHRCKLTSIDFDPDYEAMGAFKIQLPEGTIAGDGDFPGVRYQVTGGRLEPLFDKSVIDALDANVDLLREDSNAVPETSTDTPAGDDVVKQPAQAESGGLSDRVAANPDAEDAIGFGTDTKKHVLYGLSAAVILIVAFGAYRYRRQKGRNET